VRGAAKENTEILKTREEGGGVEGGGGIINESD
jgi:hypothetical protein